MQKKEVVQLLAYLRQMYPIRTDDPELTIIVWADALVDWEGRYISAAAREYVKTDTTGFAPKAGQLIAIARELRRNEYVARQIPEQTEQEELTEEQKAIREQRWSEAKAILRG